MDRPWTENQLSREHTNAQENRNRRKRWAMKFLSWASNCVEAPRWPVRLLVRWFVGSVLDERRPQSVPIHSRPCNATTCTAPSLFLKDISKPTSAINCTARDLHSLSGAGVDQHEVCWIPDRRDSYGKWSISLMKLHILGGILKIIWL